MIIATLLNYCPALEQRQLIESRVLNSWGIRQCADFGQIVFNLVNKDVLGKTDEDSIHDFDGGYDFETAFRAPFHPEQKCTRLPSGHDT